MTTRSFKVIYDFGLFPYALGDVITWNIQMAIRCLNLGRASIDLYICVDPEKCSSIFQRDLINRDNYFLHFSDIFNAFYINPLINNVYTFSNTKNLIEKFSNDIADDLENREILQDYQVVLGNQENFDLLVDYFTNHIYYHKHINDFYERNDGIPYITEVPGTKPDLAGIRKGLFANKKIVTIHFRLRRLDAAMAGAHTYARDSNFLAWYGFLKEAEKKFPHVQFLLAGRIQEKPLEVLKLPNVTSLRLYGFGLAHELSMMLQSSLFIGTSSGYAAAANFSDLPYFITNMNPESCNAYDIEEGAEQLPFATDQQFLVYEKETPEMLLSLLERGLSFSSSDDSNDSVDENSIDAGAVSASQILFSSARKFDVERWSESRQAFLYPGSTSYRFVSDDANYQRNETAFLLKPVVDQADELLLSGDVAGGRKIITQLGEYFPWVYRYLPTYAYWQKVFKPWWTIDYWIVRVEFRLRRYAKRIAARLDDMKSVSN